MHQHNQITGLRVDTPSYLVESGAPEITLLVPTIIKLADLAVNNSKEEKNE